MPSPQDLLREYVGLNRRRVAEGITPLEYQRWLDLGEQLARSFPNHPRLGPRGETRIRTKYRTRCELRESIMSNVRPIGLFVNTPFAADAGTEFELVVHLEESGEIWHGRVVVVSNNVGPGFTTASLGMGVRFRTARCELRAAVDAIWNASSLDS